MEAVLFIEIQATGKSCSYLERFFRTHVRVKLDMPSYQEGFDKLLLARMNGQGGFITEQLKNVPS